MKSFTTYMSECSKVQVKCRSLALQFLKHSESLQKKCRKCNDLVNHNLKSLHMRIRSENAVRLLLGSNPGCRTSCTLAPNAAESFKNWSASDLHFTCTLLHSDISHI